MRSMMKVNLQVLCIPPYVSTTWKNVLSLHLEHAEETPLLVVTLINGARVEIPDLEEQVVEAIFAIHAKFLSENTHLLPLDIYTHAKELFLRMPSSAKGELGQINLIPAEGQGVLPVLEHNPEHADLPPFPKELLHKVITLSKEVGMEDALSALKAEPHCNCTHCQIAHTIQAENFQKAHLQEEMGGEEVLLEELSFRSWDIESCGNSLYQVVSTEDSQESYTVQLSNPPRCTCGKENCEHVKAVLDK